jgi:hypothetical protein
VDACRRIAARLKMCIAFELAKKVLETIKKSIRLK